MTKNDNFKTVKFLKVEWLKNTSDTGGAMKRIIDNINDEQIVIHSHTQKLGRL